MDVETDTAAPARRRWLSSRAWDAEDPDNRYARAALERHKREGLDLAVRARWIALGIITVMLPLLNPQIEMLYYVFLLAIMAGLGWAQRHVGRVGRSRAELVLILCDLVVLTVALALPNPFSASELAEPMNLRFGNFIYFFVILAAATMAYSWRTILSIGTWVAVSWIIVNLVSWWLYQPDSELAGAALAAFGHDPRVFQLMDPNSFQFDIRMQEAVVFVLVAFTLGFSNRRFNVLLLNNAGLERERANLSRYFSPTMVEELSQNDEPLKQIREHDVAVLFVDIVGFTEFAAQRPPDQVIALLRGFHARMEGEVFAHAGTLDKYLGDGLMATFGTPFAGPSDASNALSCVRAMIAALEAWNTERRAQGEPEIHGCFGLHFGPVVLGDIGANRLEFAVIGNTVNVASRLEALNRTLQSKAVISGPARDRVVAETGREQVADLAPRPRQKVRGIDAPMEVWTL